MRELTERFFGSLPHGERESDLYGDVMITLLADMELAVRAELSRRFSEEMRAPSSLIKVLAIDEAEVAEPVLRSSPVLTEADLLAIVRTEGQAHLRAVSQRPVLSEAVADMIVSRSDDETLRSLLGNDGAALSRTGSEQAIERAKRNPDLHAVAVDRRTLPPDLLNEMYFVVGEELRRRIVARNASLDQDLLENALAVGLAKLATHDGVWPDDYFESLTQVKHAKSGARLLPAEVARILRSGNRTAFCIALSELADVDFFTVSRVIALAEVDGLAVLSKAAGLDGPLFLTIAVSLLGGSQDGMGKARSYSLHYAELTQEAASRTLRFWRLRRGRPDSMSASVDPACPSDELSQKRLVRAAA